MNKLPSLTLVLAAGLVVGLGGSALAAQTADDPGIFPLAEVQRGQTGYGLSVFAGSEPERFDVEVIGVMNNTRPGLSAILARLSGHDLERSGVVAGMSGSPVYIDDRLVGAVAYSYPFGFDAIAGITPIEAMRDVPAGTLSGVPASPAARTAVGWRDLVQRDFGSDRIEKDLALWSPAGAAGGRSAVQWSAAGFGGRPLDLLQGAVGELAPWVIMAGTAASGTAGPSAAAGELVPGSAVAMVLVRGDLSLAASGTVTDRHGDDVLAFGHPVFGLGPASLPMARAEVVTMIANRYNSFRLSNVGDLVGTFDQDRAAGARGRLGPVPAMIPVDVRLRGASHRDYRMEVADLPLLSPLLIAISAYGALDAGAYANGPQGLDLEARFVIAGHDDLVVRQTFDGAQAAPESITYLYGFGAFLQLNDLEAVDLERVDVELTQVDRPRLATLIGAYPDHSEVEPGDTVTLSVEFQAFRGARYRRSVETVVPATVPDGRYVLLVGDGTSMDAARLGVEHREPETFAQALRLMQSFHPRDELHVVGLLVDPGLAVAGDVLPSLPGSVRSIFSGGGPGTVQPLGLAIAHETVAAQDRPISGVVRVDLEVRRKGS